MVANLGVLTADSEGGSVSKTRTSTAVCGRDLGTGGSLWLLAVSVEKSLR